MGNTRSILAWSLAAGLLIPMASQGAVYSCKGADGQMAFSDIPCGGNAQKVEVTPAVPGNGAASSSPVLSTNTSNVTPRRTLAQEPAPMLGMANQCLSEEGIATIVSRAPASEKASLQARLDASNQLECRHFRRRGAGAEALQARRAQMLRSP